jgi:glyoxylase-like metal-dependent hydrolase (beta-lactamase superfamily II)
MLLVARSGCLARADTRARREANGAGASWSRREREPYEEDIDAYAAFASSKSMRITNVVGTHVHADHRSGSPALARKVGAPF